MKTCVLIPTYNEAKQIGKLTTEIKQRGIDILVVDDGSKDDTAAIAKDAGATVLRNEQNQGKGVSLRQGFNYLLAQDYEAIITMDGDGQHHPVDINLFTQSAYPSDVGMIIGNRMYSARGMPCIRWLTNKFTSRIISCLIKQEIPDSQSGFRLIKTSVLKKINLCTSKYEIESELIVRIARLGSRIKSIPIQTIYQNQKSQINPLVDTLRFIKFILKELWISKS